MPKKKEEAICPVSFKKAGIKKFWKVGLVILVFAVMGLVNVGVVSAQDCDITLNPGDDLQKAIDDAEEGDVVCLNPGTYNAPKGGIEINKKEITILGVGSSKPEIKPAPEGHHTILINVWHGHFTTRPIVPDAKVTLKNLKINGINDAIYIGEGEVIRIEDCKIVGGAESIYSAMDGGYLYLKNNEIYPDYYSALDQQGMTFTLTAIDNFFGRDGVFLKVYRSMKGWLYGNTYTEEHTPYTFYPENTGSVHSDSDIWYEYIKDEKEYTEIANEADLPGKCSEIDGVCCPDRYVCQDIYKIPGSSDCSECCQDVKYCVLSTQSCSDLGGTWCQAGQECDGTDLTSSTSDAEEHPGQICCDGSCVEPEYYCKHSPPDGGKIGKCCYIHVYRGNMEKSSIDSQCQQICQEKYGTDMLGIWTWYPKDVFKKKGTSSKEKDICAYDLDNCEWGSCEDKSVECYTWGSEGLYCICKESPSLLTCSQQGGTCCSADQTCQGGSFATSSDCGTLCCVDGTCQTPTPPPPPTTVSISLFKGWNFISSPTEAPLTLSKIEESCTLKEYEGYKIYVYDPATRRWLYPNEIKKDEGGYVYASDNCTINLSGTPAKFSTKSLVSGWNTISTETSLNEIIGDCKITSEPKIWEWNAENKTWVHPSMDDKLSQGKGYWIAVESDCTLGEVIPPPPIPTMVWNAVKGIFNSIVDWFKGIFK